MYLLYFILIYINILFVLFLLKFVFWCYKASKNGKYFIYPEGRIFGVHIRYVKVRRAVPLNGSQSRSQRRFTKERSTPVVNRPRGSLGLEASNSNFLYRSPREGDGSPLQYSCLENFLTEEPGGLQLMGLKSRI